MEARSSKRSKIIEIIKRSKSQSTWYPTLTTTSAGARLLMNISQEPI